MEAHLVLKSDPESGPDPVFHRAPDGSNSIVFKKFETQFDFKSVMYPEDGVFAEVAAPLVKEKLFNKKDSILITLGPTNSGKSHLLFDDSGNSIINQTLESIFNNIGSLATSLDQIKKYYPNIVDARTLDSDNIDTSMNSTTYCTISMFELYNDTVVDLLPSSLPSSASQNPKNRLDIVTDPVDHKLTPRNISRYLVNSFESSHNIIYKGLSNRKTDVTYANNYSSRSHCFIFLNIHKVYASYLQTSRLSIVDLAGLERSKSARTSGHLLKEASYTNGSLTELGRCLEMMSMKEFNKTCLRTNKLTRLVFNDYVKSKHPIKILVTLDPFGEKGLITQTLRYINPIQYQVLHRKSLILLGNPKSMTNSRTTSQHDQRGLITEIDNLRSTRKSLEKQLQNLKESSVENENRLRVELFQENEQNLTDLRDNYTKEISDLRNALNQQTDKKLADISDSYRSKIEQLTGELDTKQEEVFKLTEIIESNKIELQTLNDEIECSLQDSNKLKSSSTEKIVKLTAEIERSNIENENLKVEINMLHLRIEEMENAHSEKLKNLTEGNTSNILNLENEVQRSRDKVNDLNRQVDELSRELANQRSINSDNAGKLEKAKTEYAENLEKLTSDLKEKDAHYTSILNEETRQKEKLLENIEGMKKQIGDLEFEKSCLSQELSELKETIGNDRKKYISDSESKDLEINAKILEKDSKIQALSNQIEKLSADLMIKERDVESSSSKLNDLQILFDEKTAELSSLLDSKSESYNALANEKNAFLKKIEDLQLINAQYSDKIEQLNSKLVEEKQKKKEMSLKLKDSTKSNDHFDKAISTLNNTIISLNESIDAKSNELEKMVSSKQNVDDELAKLNLKYSDLKSEYGDLMKYKEKYTSLKSYYDKYVEELKEQRMKFALKLDNSKREVSDNQKIIDELNKLLSQRNEKVETLQKEVEQSRADNASIESNLSMQGKNIEDLTNEVKQRDKIIDEITNKLKQAEARILSDDVGADGLRQKVKELQKENDRLSGKKPTKATRSSPRKSVSATPSNPRSSSVLDSDFDNDEHLPLIFSSPMRKTEFKIHEDAKDENQTITFGMKPKSSKKSSKKQNPASSKENSNEDASSVTSSPTKKSRSKTNVLENSATSALNRQDVPSLNLKLKKRKSMSPTRTKKKRVKNDTVRDTSLDNLD